jgi:cobalt-zinc-cadmium efflux system outer membrane protein
VTLTELLKHAIEHAPAIVISRAGIAAGRAELEATRPSLPSDPVVSGKVGRRWTAAGSGIDYAIGVAQELDISGRRGMALAAAQSNQRAHQAELHAAEWLVHQKVHAGYHQALVARERVTAAEQVLRFSERLAHIARERFAAGDTSPLPARLAAGEVAQAKQAAMLAASEYDSLRLELARAAGYGQAVLLTPTGTLDAPETPPDARALIRTAKRQQPALRAAEARTEAARAELAAAERRSVPNLTVGVSYENEADPGTSPTHILSGSLSIPLPLWVGSKLETGRARARVEQARAEQVVQGGALGARIVQARERADINARRARLFGAEILPTFEKNLELLQKAFELGEVDILQVMVAQERFLRTQQEALQAFADYYEAWAELEAAVGAELHDPAHGAAK